MKQPGSAKVKSLETLTPAQSAQEALEIERERYRSSPCLKGPGGLDKQGPTLDAVTVLRNEDRRRKVNLSRQKGLVAKTSRSGFRTPET